ncbi:transposase [Fibrella arboris]|uniref:transposase n=1 Tax=Fibrella arboris TaxID=3242486 RepID=UPI003522BE40
MTERYKGKYRIPSIRLADYDYGSNGLYFVTICTRERQPFMGDIVMVDQEAVINPSEVGQIAIDYWLSIPTFHPYVALDAFQLMPDHLHAILSICKPDHMLTEWQPNQFGPQRQNLASILRGYKSAVTRQAAAQHLAFGWQPRFYERVIRNQNELDRIRTYIENNPNKWNQERDNPENLYM